MRRSCARTSEFGVSRCRPGRIDARDFEPDPALEGQFEPLIDRDDPPAGAAFIRAKPGRRLHFDRPRKHNQSGRENNSEAHVRKGAEAKVRAHGTTPKRAPKLKHSPKPKSSRKRARSPLPLS